LRLIKLLLKDRARVHPFAGNGGSSREADIPTNAIEAVAAEPGGVDEFADRGVAREFVDALGFDRRPLRASRGWR
jgi:hypothetical protein